MDYKALLLSGMELITSTGAVEPRTIQKRQHKKKRTNKKWLKKYGMQTILVPTTRVFIMGNKILGHPSVIEKIKKLAT